MIEQDFIIERDGTIRRDYCRRESGSYRAYFRSQEEVEAFAADPANVAYHGDIAHKCGICGAWHLSRPEWLVPEWARNMKGKSWS
jgi:hypothetical protein